MSFAFDCPILFKTNRIGGAMVSLVDSTSVYYCSIGFWNYSDSVIFFVLIFYLYILTHLMLEFRCLHIKSKGVIFVEHNETH
jgi:hypothetical protein